MKIICIDYDGTITHFPELMSSIIAKSKELGYKVILTTMRYESEEDDGIKLIRNMGIDVYFTGRRAKQVFLDSLGIKPDLWIDDNPKWILKDA